MDINKLQLGNLLLEKAKATSILINAFKNLDSDSKDFSDDFKKALNLVKDDVYIKLIELKSSYENEFNIL